MAFFARSPAKTLSLFVGVHKGDVNAKRVFYTAKSGTGFWTALEEVIDHNSSATSVFGEALACVYVGSQLHLCATSATGQFVHAVRRGRSWEFVDIPTYVPPRPMELGAATVDGELHVCMVTEDGGLFHAIRHVPPRWLIRDPWWEDFSNVKRLAEDDPGRFRYVSCAELDGQLCVVANVDLAGPWVTFRHPDGSWDSFTDLRTIIGDPGEIATVSSAATRNPQWLADIFHVTALVAKPNEWWPQIVDLQFDGNWHAPFIDIGQQSYDARQPAADVACTAAHQDLDVFIYQYPLDKIWHGTDQGNHQWQTETLTPPQHDPHRAGRLACAAYRSSLSVQRGLLGATLVLLVSALAVIRRQSIAAQTSEGRWWRRLRSGTSSGKRLPS